MKKLLFFILPLLLWGCGQSSVHRHQILTFGTVIDISIRHDDEQLVERAFKRLEADFQTMHRTWHPWEDSDLTQTNLKLQTGEWFTASSSVLPLLRTSQQIAIQSGHYFNPAIGKLVQLWGFHRQDPQQPFTPDLPAIRQIQKNLPNMTDIEFDDLRMRGNNPELQIDIGGIAKGYAIDLVINTLRKMGIKNAIINAGGDLRSIGTHSERPWKIGIQHPRKKQVLASIETLRDESIFTSGDYQRFYMQEDRRRHHIIDPFSGEPVAHTIAVTVIHDNATIADAAATALMVAGKQNWQRTAQAMGIKYVLLLTQDGELHMNPAMHKRLKLINTDDLKIIISPPLKEGTGMRDNSQL